MKPLDTSVLVDIDRGGVDRRVEKLDEEGRPAISIVTVTELRLGINKRYERETNEHRAAIDALDRLLARFDIKAITRPVAITAANIITDLQQRGQALNDLHDVYIAATARTEQLTVLTENVNHFDRIEDVAIVDWTEY